MDDAENSTQNEAAVNLHTGTAGWKQFLLAKWDIVQAYQRAKHYSQAHIVQTSHGNVAAAAIRTWLERFLPKQFGVCNGYIAAQQQSEPHRFPHFDVIIFDQMRAPILWYEENLDSSQPAKARAIPAEFVHCVIEIKSRLTSQNAKDAVEHLRLLDPLVWKPGSEEGRFISNFPKNFVTYAIFVEMIDADKYSDSILKNLSVEFSRFAGAIALHGEGLDIDYTWRTDAAIGNLSEMSDSSDYGRAEGQHHLLEANFGGVGPTVDLGDGRGIFTMAKCSGVT